MSVVNPYFFAKYLKFNNSTRHPLTEKKELNVVMLSESSEIVIILGRHPQSISFRCNMSILNGPSNVRNTPTFEDLRT